MAKKAAEIEEDGGESTALALVSVQEIVPVALFASGESVDALLAKLVAEVRGKADTDELDISTAKGRKLRRSLAFGVSRSKTFLDGLGKDLNESKRHEIDAVDLERRKIRTCCDALRDEVNLPVDEWETADETRIKGHEDAIAAIAAEPGGDTVAELQRRLVTLQNWPPRDWQEFKRRADKALAAEIDATTKRILEVEQREQAERDRVAREQEDAARQAEQDRLEREAREKRIAEEAAAEATRRAEEAAQAERAAAAAREREAEQAKLDAQRRQQEAEEAAESARYEAQELRAANERRRIREHQARLDIICEVVPIPLGTPAARISEWIAATEEMAPPDTLIDWEEFTDGAKHACEAVLAALRPAYDEAVQREAAAEAEMKRTAAHEKRLDEIASIAAAFHVNSDASEQKIQGAIDSVQRAGDLEWDEFSLRAKTVIADAVASLRRSEERAKNFREQAEAETAERIKRDQDAAVAAALEADRKQRPAPAPATLSTCPVDRALQGKMNTEAMTDLVNKAGLKDVQARNIIKMIASGQIRNVSMVYTAVPPA